MLLGKGGRRLIRAMAAGETLLFLYRGGGWGW